MLKKIKTILLMATMAALIGACTGEDGEIGPAGEQGTEGEKGEKGDKGDDGEGLEKLGSLTGTISGTRRDGTPFSKPFSYEYSFSNQMAFYEHDGVKYLEIERSAGPQSSDYFDATFKLEDGILQPASSQYSTYLSFSAEENPTTLFSLEAEAYYEEMPGFVVELSDELNDSYRFGLNGNGQLSYYTYNLYIQEEEYIPVHSFTAYLNNTYYHIYFHQDTGELYAVQNGDGESLLFSGVIFNFYSGLKFIYNPAVGTETFFDSETDEDLSAVSPPTPADQFVVTNYNHDPATGVLSFNFTLHISGNRGTQERTNTTRHDLTLTGTYNSGVKVYANTVGRIKNN